MLSSTIISMPANDRDFEEKCVVLFCGLLQDPNVKTVGTRGQDQKGLDLLGRLNRDPAQPVGVQCKLRTKGDRLTETEVREEVTAALAVSPPLTEYYIVTTAPDDTKLDLLAGALSLAQKNAGRTIDIQVWGWDTLQQKIRADAKALNAFDPGHSATLDALKDLGSENLAVSQRVAEQVRVTREILTEQIRVAMAITDSDPARRSDLEAHLNAEVDRYRDLLREGKPRTAFDLLRGLEARLTSADSAHIRARVRSNMGIAWLNLGDIAKAAAAMADARVIDPDDRKVAANAMLGLAISGQEASAAALARAALLANPTDAGAAAALLVAAVSSDTVGDPMADIPEPLLADKHVAFNWLNWLRAKGPLQAWREAAWRSAEVFPDTEVLQWFSAEATLDAALEGVGPDGALGLADVDFDKTRDAAVSLQTVWDRVQAYENAGEAWTSTACNLVTAWRVLGEMAAARRVAERALQLAPADPTVVGVAAQLALDDGRPSDAARLASALPEGRLRTMMSLTGMANAGDYRGVIAAATEGRRAGLEPDDQSDFDSLLFQAKVVDGAVTDRRAAADALVAAWPDNPRAHVVASGALRTSDPDRADELAEAAVALLREDSKIADRIMIAQLAMSRADPDAVITALDGHVPTVRQSEALGWLAWAFGNAAPRPRTKAFFDSLPVAVLAESRYARAAGAAESARGDLANAERHLRGALASEPDDLSSHLLLVSVLERDNRGAEATAHLLALDEARLKGEPRAMMRLAHLLRHAGASIRGLAVGYAAAATSRDDSALLSHYPGLIFFGDTSADAIPPADTAGLDIWFDLEGLEGAEDVAGVVEAETVSGIGYRPDHPLAQALDGKAVGDEVTLEAGGFPRRYRLRGLKPKVVWLLHDIMATYNERFPDATGLLEMKVKDGDIRPMLEVVRRSSEQQEILLQAYAEMPLPLAAVALMAHRNVLELAEYLPSIGHEVRACVGTNEERVAGIAALAAAQGQGVALDLLTAWTAYRLNLLPSMKATFGRLLLPRSAIDSLMEFLRRRELDRGRESMTISYWKGEPFRELRSPEQTESAIEALQSGLAAIRDFCVVMPTDGSETLRLDGETIDRFTVAEVLDPAHLAINHQVPLLSDDLHLRQLADQNAAPPGGWLQAAMAVMADTGHLAGPEHLIALGQLAGLRHGHIWLTVETLLALAALEDPRVDGLFHAATQYICGPKSDPASNLPVALYSFRALWVGRLPDHIVGRRCGRLLERMIDGQPNWADFLQKLHRYLLQQAKTQPVFDRAAAYLRGWVRGHFLPVDVESGPDASHWDASGSLYGEPR